MQITTRVGSTDRFTLSLTMVMNIQGWRYHVYLTILLVSSHVVASPSDKDRREYLYTRFFGSGIRCKLHPLDSTQMYSTWNRLCNSFRWSTFRDAWRVRTSTLCQPGEREQPRLGIFGISECDYVEQIERDCADCLVTLHLCFSAPGLRGVERAGYYGELGAILRGSVYK